MITALAFSLVLVSFVYGGEDCGPNEKWTKCPGCEIKCGESENKACTRECRPPACFCSPALNLRRKADGSCVPVDKCPPQTEPESTVLVEETNPKDDLVKKTVIITKKMEFIPTITITKKIKPVIEVKRIAKRDAEIAQKTEPATLTERNSASKLIRKDLKPAILIKRNFTNKLIRKDLKPVILIKKNFTSKVIRKDLRPFILIKRNFTTKMIRKDLKPVVLIKRNFTTKVVRKDLKPVIITKKDFKSTVLVKTLTKSKLKPLIIHITKPHDKDHRRCRRNEQWTECTGCELKCGQNVNTPCPLTCNPASCFCSPHNGFRRAADGRCVPEEQCPRRPQPPKNEEDNEPEEGEEEENGENKVVQKKCGLNERWKECPGCEMKCSDNEITVCPLMCGTPACYCSSEHGFRRHDNGSCIPADMCPEKGSESEVFGSEICDENEEWVTCGSCEASCDVPKVACSRKCKPPRCECVAAKGFVRDSFGNCIMKSSCPKSGIKKVCRKNEHWTTCGTCESTCDRPQIRCNFKCKPPRCQCNAVRGFVRDKDGNCVRLDECPVKKPKAMKNTMTSH